ncbi:hypothetical protein M8J75_006630 [Diaphorina citri]|nr:hypothetical protein M8J75_006630 [Diaphorina citri]
MNFTGKVILVTGASSGIGAATALHLAKLDAKLAITGRNVEQLNKVSESCQSVSKNKPLVIQADLTSEEDTKRIIDTVVKHYQKLNVLVNNAGILEAGSIENTSLEQYDKIMNVNVRSIYHLTMLAVPHLISTKGNIVNVSSVNGLRSFPGVLAYCVSKAAVDQFTSCTALELASKGVRVNSGIDQQAYQNFLERSKETHALGRVGNPEEVAKAIAFLASDDASFTTGEHLTVDGGRHAMCPR